jgi:hypothetical protein
LSKISQQVEFAPYCITRGRVIGAQLKLRG